MATESSSQVPPMRQRKANWKNSGGKIGGNDEARTGAENRACGGGIALLRWRLSADNVFLARACGANDNEHLCHTRNLLAAGSARPSGEPQPDRLRRMGKSCACWDNGCAGI